MKIAIFITLALSLTGCGTPRATAEPKLTPVSQFASCYIANIEGTRCVVCNGGENTSAAVLAISCDWSSR